MNIEQLRQMKFSVPLEARMISVEIDEEQRVCLKWKVGNLLSPETFDEPESDEPKPYMIGEVRLSKELVDAATSEQVGSVIAQMTAKDILEMAIFASRNGL